MKVVGVLFAFFVCVAALSWYGIAFLMFHETKISDEEIVIGRAGVIPGSGMTYAVNLESGDEDIVVRNLVGDTWDIEYNGKCQCVMRAFKRGEYSVSLWVYGDGNVYYRAGETIEKELTYEKARPMFEEALAVRNALREKYAEYFPQ